MTSQDPEKKDRQTFGADEEGRSSNLAEKLEMQGTDEAIAYVSTPDLEVLDKAYLPPMYEEGHWKSDVTIANKQGLHARPASQLVMHTNDIYNKSDITVYLSNERTKVNARSIMGLLTLAAPLGSTLTVEAEGSPGLDDPAREAVLSVLEFIAYEMPKHDYDL